MTPPTKSDDIETKFPALSSPMGIWLTQIVTLITLFVMFGKVVSWQKDVEEGIFDSWTFNQQVAFADSFRENNKDIHVPPISRFAKTKQSKGAK